MSEQVRQADENFVVKPPVIEEDMTLYDPWQKPFSVHGLMWESPEVPFVRMPVEIAKQVSGPIGKILVYHTAGGRLRFRTDSPYIFLRVKLIQKQPSTSVTDAAKCGFDLYVRHGEEDRYVRNFPFPWDYKDTYESRIDFPDSSLREVTLHFPLYCGISQLQIGLKSGALLQEARPYRHSKPVLYYGSSITQGLSASRPGNTYQNIIARELDTDFINLGFSGNAHGEDAIAEYLASLDPSVFVYDYDHNAHREEELAGTHEKLFLTFRKQHPTTPVIILSRPQLHLGELERKFHAIVQATYYHAVTAGDRNVYWIDGNTIFHRPGGDGATADGTHPNDLGFRYMADAIESVLRGLL